MKISASEALTYEMQLDPGKLAGLRARWFAEGPRGREALEGFLTLLGAAAAAADTAS